MDSPVPTGTYEAPTLVDLGHVREITRGGNKDWGTGDMWTFQNNSTRVTS